METVETDGYAAWLIENGKKQGEGLAYLCMGDLGMFTWTEDVYAALHFCRRSDAEKVSAECEDAWRIVEHSFGTTLRAERDALKAEAKRLDDLAVHYGKENQALKAELAERSKHMEESDRELLQIEDWLITNAEIDPKTGLIDRAAKCKERIRDLIAAEGEFGDLKAKAEALASAFEDCIFYMSGHPKQDVMAAEERAQAALAAYRLKSPPQA